MSFGSTLTDAGRSNGGCAVGPRTLRQLVQGSFAGRSKGELTVCAMAGT